MDHKFSNKNCFQHRIENVASAVPMDEQEMREATAKTKTIFILRNFLEFGIFFSIFN